MDLSLSAADEAFAGELAAWLGAHPAPPPAPPGDLAAQMARDRAFQAELAAARWVGVAWPEAHGGRGATPTQVALYHAVYARSGAPQLVNRVGVNLAGPTLLEHGSAGQKERWLRPILSAAEIWCQLFSEPEAGSDLGSLATVAEPAAGGYRVTGTKIWTSYAQFARWGLCLARIPAPQAHGPQAGQEPAQRRATGAITCLAVDMEASGVRVRPLVQATGDAEFNEVFLDGVFVPVENRIGEAGAGWAVASSTLAHERGTTFPFKEQAVHENYLGALYRLAAERGVLDDPATADALAGSYVALGVLRLHNLRTLSRVARGLQPGPESSWVKLAWTEMSQAMADAAIAIAGTGSAAGIEGPWQRQWLWSRAASIAGGTSEIQRDIIASRILRLPRA